MINYGNFDEYWIEYETILENKSKNYKSIKLNEINGARNIIKNALIEVIIKHYISQNEVKRLLNNEKFSTLESVIKSKLPKNDLIRKGDFGEIIAMEHLKQKYGYYFPIFKLRYKNNPEKPLHGEDIIAFKIENNKITAVCIGESKVNKRYNSRTLQNAFSQLCESNINPKSLQLISTYLIEKENFDLADQIYELLDLKNFNKIDKDNWIFYITGNYRKKYLDVDNSHNNLSNLVLINFYLEDLENFINELFNECEGYYGKN